jgi:hypothetical protein
VIGGSKSPQLVEITRTMFVAKKKSTYSEIIRKTAVSWFIKIH